MGNSLLAVRGINHKYIVVEREEALIAIGRRNIITDGLRQMWQDEIDEYENTIQEEVAID